MRNSRKPSVYLARPSKNGLPGNPNPRALSRKNLPFFWCYNRVVVHGDVDSQQNPKGEPVGAYHEDDPVPEGYVSIPEYRITFGAGSCEPPTIEEEKNARKALYRQDFFDAHNVKAEDCKRYKVAATRWSRHFVTGILYW